MSSQSCIIGRFDLREVGRNGFVTQSFPAHHPEVCPVAAYARGLEDVGALGRLIQSIKTGLRYNSYAGAKIFGKYLTLQADEINLAVNIRRAHFNRAIGNELADIREALQTVVDAASIDTHEIDVLVLTGGSSAIPLFQNLLQRKFPQARFVYSDLLGSVAGGLGIYAHETDTMI